MFVTSSTKVWLKCSVLFEIGSRFVGMIDWLKINTTMVGNRKANCIMGINRFSVDATASRLWLATSSPLAFSWLNFSKFWAPLPQKMHTRLSGPIGEKNVKVHLLKHQLIFILSPKMRSNNYHTKLLINFWAITLQKVDFLTRVTFINYTTDLKFESSAFAFVCFERSIFQTFWKLYCCAKFLFIELATSNFGYLLIF